MSSLLELEPLVYSKIHESDTSFNLKKQQISY